MEACGLSMHGRVLVPVGVSWQGDGPSFTVINGVGFGSLWAVQGKVIGFTGTKHACSPCGRLIGRLSSHDDFDRVGTWVGDTGVVSVGSGGQGGRSVPRLYGFGRCPLFTVGTNVGHAFVESGTSEADGAMVLPGEVPDTVPHVVVGARSVLPFQGSCSSNSGSGSVVSVTTPVKFGASVMGSEEPRTK